MDKKYNLTSAPLRLSSRRSLKQPSTAFKSNIEQCHFPIDLCQIFKYLFWGFAFINREHQNCPPRLCSDLILLAISHFWTFSFDFHSKSTGRSVHILFVNTCDSFNLFSSSPSTPQTPSSRAYYQEPIFLINFIFI